MIRPTGTAGTVAGRAYRARSAADRIGERIAAAFICFFVLYFGGHIAVAMALRGWPL